MSLAEYFQKQCTDKLEENIALTLAKLADPTSFINVSTSGALKDAAAGGMGGLADFATDYLKDNADTLALQALKVTGLEDKVLDALNIFYNMIAQAMAAYNDLILILLKQQAKALQAEYDKKIALENQMRLDLIAIINTMKSLDAGDPIFDAYLAQLRAALVELDQGRRNIRLVRDTLSATDAFLPKLYRKGKKQVIDASTKIKPPTDSLKRIIEEQHDGFVTRTEPNILISGKAPNLPPPSTPVATVTPTQPGAPQQLTGIPPINSSTASTVAVSGAGSGSTGSGEYSTVQAGDQVVILAVAAGTPPPHLATGTFTVVKKVSDSALQLDRPLFITAPVDATGQIAGITYYVQRIIKGVGLAIKEAIIQNAGVPTQPQQIENILATPKAIKNAIVTAKNYGIEVATINTRLEFYYGGLLALQTGLPAVFKKYVLGLFDNLLKKLDLTTADVARTVNGAPTAISPNPGFAPNALNVCTHSFKWAMDLNLLVELFKTIPASTVVVQPQTNGRIQTSGRDILASGLGIAAAEYSKVKPGNTVEITGGTGIIPGTYTAVKILTGDYSLVLDRSPLAPGAPTITVDVAYSIETDGALGEFQLNQNLVGVYKNTVAQLQALGTIQNGQASLVAVQAKENMAAFEPVMLTFLLQSAASIVSPSLRKQLVSLGTSLVHRCELAATRDAQIKAILQTFIDTPIPLEDTLQQLLSTLQSVLKGLGLDKALDLFNLGDYASLFGLNSKNATYIGAALEAIALLKACFPTEAQQGQLDDTESEIEGQQDLFNIKLSFDFDLAILKNLQACLDLTNLAKLFQQKEFLCKLVQSAASKTYDALDDLVSPPMDVGDFQQTSDMTAIA